MLAKVEFVFALFLLMLSIYCLFLKYSFGQIIWGHLGLELTSTCGHGCSSYM